MLGGVWQECGPGPAELRGAQWPTSYRFGFGWKGEAPTKIDKTDKKVGTLLVVLIAEFLVQWLLTSIEFLPGGVVLKGT